MSTTPDPGIVREIAREIILKQAKYWNAMEIRQDYRSDPRCARLDAENFTDLRDAVINAIVDATVTVSWPDEQPAAEQDGDVRAVARVWMYGTQEHSSEHAYTTLEAAQSEAIWEYDPTLAEEPEYWSWEPCPPQDGRLAMLCGDDRTGYTVYPVTIVEQSTAALDARDADGSAS